MKTRTPLLFLATTLLVIAVSPLRAQVVADGATNTLNNVTNSIVGDVTVGTNGSFTLLILANNALLTNSGHGYLGRNAGANANAVRLAGANTRWLMGGDLYAGNSGAFSWLVISNGALVRNSIGYLGYNSSSSNNLMLVTGAGSLWTNGGHLNVGYSGANNQLVVSNGGLVRNNNGTLGVFASSSNNLGVVTGTGSRWTNEAELFVGYNGAGNQLMVSDGGVVRNTTGTLGYSGSSSSNAVVVTGAGSLWTNELNLAVGNLGAGNQLVVSNGGVVWNDIGYVGVNSTSSNNEVRVTGAGSFWNNEASLTMGLFGAGNRLVITNGGRVENDSSYLGGDFIDGNNEVLVTGAGSIWSNRFRLDVGLLGSGNRVVITNGGTVFAGTDVLIGHNPDALNNVILLSTGALLTNGGNGLLGFSTGANSNTASLSGSNTRWLMGGDLYVGSNGALNRLVISNGALLRNDYGYVGFATSSSDNVALVTGAGSLWTNSADLLVGVYGAGNQLVVSNGAVVRSDSSALGRLPTSSSNAVVVTGAGSLWVNEVNTDVGIDGPGNQLVVSNGGVVRDNTGFVGENSTSSNNMVVVTGAGSLWTNRVTLVVGYYGAGNQLVVSNGGVVRSYSISLGFISTSNVAVVTGAGSLWASQDDFFVGYFGAGNQMVVSNGGAVWNGDGYIGNDSTSSKNVAVVSGVGSLWLNASNLSVGNFGWSNQLVVSDGGEVRNNDGRLGGGYSSSNNVVVVTGAGSLWTNQTGLFVGLFGAGNQLMVTNGGVVRNTTGTVGKNLGADFNLVRVTGVGSLWTNSGNLLVGSNGAFNQLIVSAVGMVRAAGRVTLGVAATATNNSVLASGGSLTSVGLTLGNVVSRNNSVTLLSGSIWDLGGGTFIWGNAGINDTLAIDATSALTNIGGLTLDENATAFHFTNAPAGYTLNGFTTNQFQFKPTGLDAVIVGNDGPNVQLTISNSTLASTTGTIGNNATAQSNLVLIAGAGSVWSNSSTLNIGNFGSFNQLVVSNGGALRAGGLVTLGNAIGSTNNSVLAIGGLLTSVGLTLGNVASRNNSVTLLAGSQWDAGGGTFTWGNAGVGDTLTIDATSSMTNIGALTLDENDTANLLLNGSSLNAMNVGFKTSGLGALVVGNAGTNIQFTISNFIWAGTSGDIGLGATSRSNSVFLSGIGSTWSNSGALKIGNSGAFNQLVISSSAQARDNDGYLGFNSSSSNNEALVTGTGSLWSSRSNLVVGNFGSGNRLTISNAATVSATSNVFVGFNSSASNNFLLLSTGAWLTNGGDGALGLNTGANANRASISDANSRWQMGGSLYVGSNGAFNQLVISNGATVFAAPGLSVFTGGGVVVGANASASNNLLSLSGGAQLTNGANIVIGLSAGANSNTVSVSGPGTRWQMLAYGYVFVGRQGAFNRLLISNGAQVRHTYYTDAYVGYDSSSSSNNEVLVTGANSRWSSDGNLNVGFFGGGNRLEISEGARVDGNVGWIGPPNASPAIPTSNNVVLVTGANSLLKLNSFTVGNSGGGNSLVISNGGGVDNFNALMGVNPTFGNNNTALVTGINSYWSNGSSLYVSQGGSGNKLVISNGGWVDNSYGIIGSQTTANTNEVVVTGAGSVWNNRNELYVGYDGTGNRLLISNGGTVFVANKAYVGFGFYTTPSNNLLTVSGGSLIVTNLAGSGVLDIRYGTNVLNAGLIEADRLILTNASAQGGGFFNFNGGTLKTRATTNSNGQLFTVGNGTSAAAFELVGNGLHTFNHGLAIANNALLRGNGNISGTLTVAVGGTLSPGTSVGRIVLSNSPALLGNVIMEISRNGAVLTNDQVQVAGPLTYGGSLTVSNVGPGALTTGNNFQLFSASGYGGTFSTLSLPVLDAGLAWTNKLLVNGSIEIIGVASPKFAVITASGTNVIVSGTGGIPNAPYAVLTSTNVALPLINWTSIATNQFGPLGEFSFTNGIVAGTPQRYFRLRSP